MAASSLIFAYPHWFWMLPVLVLTGAGLWNFARAITKRRIANFFSNQTAEEVFKRIDWGRRRHRFAFTICILMLFATALARPLTGPKSDEGERKGADLVIVLDVSKSMWVEDVEPSRLEAAKKSLIDWIQKQKSDRIGLILFAGEAFVQAPLTFDYNALSFVLEDAGPYSVSAKGSNLPKAIETGVEMLNRSGVKSKILLIVSDGEIEGDAIAAARTAHLRDDVTIFTVGIGTTAGGKVPTFDRSKESGPRPNSPPFARSAYGAEVISKLESQTLRALAAVGGGKYYEWSATEPTFEIVREKSLMPLVEEKRKIDAKDYDEWFQIPLGLSILLLILEPLALKRRETRLVEEPGVPVISPTNYSKKRIARSAKATATALFVFGLFQVEGSANTPEPYMEEVSRLLEEGKAGEAVEHLRAVAKENPADPYINYNLGITLVRAGQAEEAMPIFETVQVLAPDPGLRARSAFQMGNIHLQAAIALKEDRTSGVSRVRALESALSCYETQQDIKATKQSRHNLDVTESELEALLLTLGKERTRADTLKTLREALQAYERATELNKDHQPLVDKGKELLANKLSESAGTLDKKAAEIEKQKVPEGKEGDKLMSKALDTRQEALGTLQEASDLVPEDQGIPEAIRKQQEKTSDLLTRMARRNADPAMKEKRDFFSNNAFKGLETAISQLDEALVLNPENKVAQELNSKVKDALLDARLTNGALALKHFRKTTKDADRLEDALSAAKEFNAALALDPGNQTAKDGLAEVEPALAELYAAVGVNEMENAKDMLGAAGSSPEAGTEGSADPADAADAAEAPASSSSSSPTAAVDSASESELRNSSATLEKSLNNLSAAVSLKPEDAVYQKSLEEAESLMGEVRDQLAKLEALKGEALGDAGQGEGEGQGEEGQGEDGPGGDPKSGPGGSMQSMSALRGKAGKGGAGGGDSQRYWDKFVREW